MLRISLLALLVLCSCDCSSMPRVQAIKDGVVDCTRTEIVQAARDMEPLLSPLVEAALHGDLTPARNALGELAKSWSIDYGMCIFRVVVDQVSRPSTTPEAPTLLAAPTKSARDVFADIARASHPGYTWRTATGDL